MRPVLLVIAACAVLLAGCSGTAPTARPQVDLHSAQQQVFTTERAFAKTMADRDHAAFTSFIADDAVFVGDKVLRGRVAVAAGWKRFFDGPAAPFSWKPDSALVLDSGKLGMTSGPVYDPAGKRVGTFQSTWRLEADGAWRVVLDRGCPPCACKSGG